MVEFYTFTVPVYIINLRSFEVLGFVGLAFFSFCSPFLSLGFVGLAPFFFFSFSFSFFSTPKLPYTRLQHDPGSNFIFLKLHS